MSARESFRVPFVQTARERHARLVELVGRGESTELRAIASELHCLSGEAGMLEFGAVAEIARVAEDAAHGGDRTEVERLVGELGRAIEVVAAGGG
jgi:HPt (histidine-containing phosphotransfer) domain-containing protein